MIFKKALTLMLLLVFMTPNIAIAKVVTIKKGTRLNLILGETITPETLVGKDFALDTKEDYVKLGKVILPKGVRFIGNLEENKKPGRLSISGKMLLRINSIKSGENTYKPVKMDIIAINGKKINKSYTQSGNYWTNFTSHVLPIHKANLSCTAEQQYNNECAFFFPMLLAPILLGAYVVSIPYGLLFATFDSGNEAVLKKGTIFKVQLGENIDWQYPEGLISNENKTTESSAEKI